MWGGTNVHSDWGGKMDRLIDNLVYAVVGTAFAIFLVYIVGQIAWGLIS